MEWTQILAIIGSNVALIVISFGSTISLFLWARSEARQDQAQIRDLIISIQEEMKDFHTKLALQDQEFKMRLCAIEEKTKEDFHDRLCAIEERKTK